MLVAGLGLFVAAVVFASIGNRLAAIVLFSLGFGGLMAGLFQFIFGEPADPRPGFIPGPSGKYPYHHFDWKTGTYLPGPWDTDWSHSRSHTRLDRRKKSEKPVVE